METSDVQMSAQVEPVAQHTSSSGVDYKLHPLVLINISDHFTRTLVAEGMHTRVLGCLLGQHKGRTVDISNSFEMRLRDECGDDVPSIQADLYEAKLDQYKQNFPSLDVVGWYTIGSGIQEHDLSIHKWLMEKTDAPILVTMDPSRSTTDAKDLPIALYESVMHVIEGAMQLQFVKANYSMETSDAERIGVDTVAHILPTGAGGADSALAQHYSGLHSAMEMLAVRVKVVLDYLRQMQEGKVPYNHKVMRMVSGLLHQLPTMDSSKFREELMTEFSDATMISMLSIMTKGVDACHELVGRSQIAYENYLKSGK